MPANLKNSAVAIGPERVSFHSNLKERQFQRMFKHHIIALISWHPHSSTLAWKIPWMEEPRRLQSMGSLRVTTERLHFHFSLSCIGGNGNPLQYSCLENPRDGEAWWAAVYGVTQSRTRLTQLSSSRERN